MMEKKIKLVLLIGSGRSGSTLIDRIISTHDNVLGVGELLNFNIDIFKEYCSCGSTVDSCSFWSQIIVKLGWKENEFEEYRKYQKMFDPPKRGSVFKSKDYSNDSAFKDYLKKNNKIYRAIAEVGGEKIIFDSSKSPQRALNLSNSNFLETKIIYLMRDPRGAVWSFKKGFQKDLKAGIQKDMKGRSMLRSVYSWIAVNSRSFSAIGNIKVPSLFVKYEEFCENPNDQIDRILKFIFNEELKDTIDLTNPTDEISHTIAGNRLRMEKSIVIRPDRNWKKNLTVFEKFLIYLLTFPWINKFSSSLEK